MFESPWKNAAWGKRLAVPVELGVNVVVGKLDAVQPFAVRRTPLQQADCSMRSSSRRDMKLRRRDHSGSPTETRAFQFSEFQIGFLHSLYTLQPIPAALILSECVLDGPQGFRELELSELHFG